ncbi:MAG: hypothetical protein A4E65_00106 [Syntrophorhabdus sp. PtaU1.Bin153]|nr:MAG: hypothetical protein A4E65_00106 [Syntrophorhabdus sp. PtaU1.Bin153]
MLTFDPSWRFQPPPDGRYRNTAIPPEAIWDFDSLIARIATQGDRWDMLEYFKGAFSRAAGQSHFGSSSESWAESDLSSVMSLAAQNAPLFLEAFYEACEGLRQKGLFAPDALIINDVCRKHGIGYELNPPVLSLRDSASTIKSEPIEVVERPPTIAEKALETLHQSLERSEQLLTEGHTREAVQESLWVLESLATAFRGIEVHGDTVQGKYFNDIARNLRRVAKGTTLERVIEWVTGLHGFLSSPTGGGVRHGMDLGEGVQIGPSEARLFCNLMRSYIGYLLAEHERLKL